MTIWCNNQSNIKILKNLIFYNNIKYFEIDWYFTKYKFEDKIIII